MRLWKQSDRLVGFAYVDDFNNLWFENDPGFELLDQLESEIVEWGTVCARKRNAEVGRAETLDSTCDARDTLRISALERHGFAQQEVRSLRYARPLAEPIREYSLPAGFSIRPVRGEGEVEALVALHRTAFGTTNMSAEQRLAMMRTPRYLRQLDLVAVAPGEELAAFCVGGFVDAALKIGHTDPIGTHPRYQRLGLAKATVTAALQKLKALGAQSAQLGTSSENIAMRELAGKLGFSVISEKVWFSKALS